MQTNSKVQKHKIQITNTIQSSTRVTPHTYIIMLRISVDHKRFQIHRSPGGLVGT